MKMKKTIAMIMAMTMITGAFAACGEKEEGTVKNEQNTFLPSCELDARGISIV